VLLVLVLALPTGITGTIQQAAARLRRSI